MGFNHNKLIFGFMCLYICLQEANLAMPNTRLIRDIRQSTSPQKIFGEQFWQKSLHNF